MNEPITESRSTVYYLSVLCVVGRDELRKYNRLKFVLGDKHCACVGLMVYRREGEISDFVQIGESL